MNRLRRCLVMLAVACAVSGSPFVLGQVAPVTGALLPQVEAKKKEAPKPTKAKAAQAERPAAKKAVVMMKPVALQPARIVGQPAAAGLAAQAEQYVQQFRPMFRAEYYFIRNVCDLTGPQRKQLARMGEQATKAAALKFVEAQQKMMRGGWRPDMHYPDPREIIEQELGKSALGLLSAEQQTRYKEELKERARSRKQLFIDNFVAKLDDDLVLTAEEREKLVKALTDNWKDEWGQSLQMLQNLDSFFPNIPDRVVVPILSKQQREVWRRIPRNQTVFWGFSFGGMMQNDQLDDPELVEAQKEAQAAQKKGK